MDIKLHPPPTSAISGLRSKEAVAIAQGPGIWTYSETQLSAITQVSTSKALKYAGTWTGVACNSGFGLKQLCIDRHGILATFWPHNIRLAATISQ